MKNINLHNPHWPDVIEATGLSNNQLSRQLYRFNIEYSANAVHNLRNGKTRMPDHDVGQALLAIMGEQKALNKKPRKIADSRTR